MFRLKSKQGVPDHIRRGIRLSVAVLLLASIGFSVVSRPGYQNVVMLLKWALLTCPVVTMPLLGKTSQVSFERALGTVVGGALGFFATALATNWWTLEAAESDDIFLAVIASAAAFLSVLVGQRFSLDLSAKLFVIAFILVCFSSQEGRDPLVVALTRVGGIVLGVVTMLVLSVLVLPKSASIEALRTLCKSLNKLQDVNRIAWGNYLPPEDQAAQLVAAGVSQAQQGQERRANDSLHGDDSGLVEPLLAPSDVESGQAAGTASSTIALGLDDLCASAMLPMEAEAHVVRSEKALIELYSVLNQLAEQLALAKTELWMSGCGGRPFLLPGLPFWHPQTSHLPWRALEEMAIAVRRVARLLNTVIFTFEDGFDQQLRGVLGPLYPSALMPTLAAGCYAAIQELCDAFPCKPLVGSEGLAAFSVAVQSLTEMNEQQRQRLKGAFKRHKSRAGARYSWVNVIGSVLEEQQSQLFAVDEGQEQQVGGEEKRPSEPASVPPEATSSGKGTAALATNGSGSKELKGDVSRADWTPHVSSYGQGTSGSIKTTMAVATVAVAAAPDKAEGSQHGSVGSSEAGNQAGSQRGSPVKTPSLVASASHHIGLFGVLDPAGTADAAAEKPEQQQQPARPPSPLLSRVSILRQGASFTPSGSMPLMRFSDTTQGRLAQVSFFSFMFMCEELREQLEGLHAAVDAVLRYLPS